MELNQAEEKELAEIEIDIMIADKLKDKIIPRAPYCYIKAIKNEAINIDNPDSDNEINTEEEVQRDKQEPKTETKKECKQQ